MEAEVRPGAGRRRRQAGRDRRPTSGTPSGIASIAGWNRSNHLVIEATARAAEDLLAERVGETIIVEAGPE